MNADHTPRIPHRGEDSETSSPVFVATAGETDRSAGGGRRHPAAGAGLVKDLQARPETLGSGQEGVTQQVLTFRLERYDDVANRLPPVPVEMRGESLWGIVTEGDWVSIPPGLPPGHTLYASELTNLTTGATFGVSGRRNHGGVFKVLALVFFFVMFVSIAIDIGGSGSTSSGGFPSAGPLPIGTILPICFVGFIVCVMLAAATGTWRWRVGRGTRTKRGRQWRSR